MSHYLERARRALNALTPDELAQLQSDTHQLLNAYQQGGALTGGGWLEVKTIPYKTKEDGKTVRREQRYLYIRRAQIDARGKVTTKTVGYYGRGGVEALEAGLGAELLAAHQAGGELAGDSFLMKHGFKLPERRGMTKPPADRPEHPLGDDSITAEALKAHPIFSHFESAAATAAAELYAEMHQFEQDKAAWEYAEEKRLLFRLPQAERQRRRQNLQRRQQPPGKRTIRHRR